MLRQSVCIPEVQAVVAETDTTKKEFQRFFLYIKVSQTTNFQQCSAKNWQFFMSCFWHFTVEKLSRKVSRSTPLLVAIMAAFVGEICGSLAIQKLELDWRFSVAQEAGSVQHQGNLQYSLVQKAFMSTAGPRQPWLDPLRPHRSRASKMKRRSSKRELAQSASQAWSQVKCLFMTIVEFIENDHWRL